MNLLFVERVSTSTPITTKTVDSLFILVQILGGTTLPTSTMTTTTKRKTRELIDVLPGVPHQKVHISRVTCWDSPL
jgi:hypothetical protein